MYAIVEIAGQQFKVERGNKVYVHRLEASEGAKVEFENVLLIENDGKIQVGVVTRQCSYFFGQRKGGCTSDVYCTAVC